MSGLLASLAVIGGFLALVAVLVIAVKLAVWWLDRRDDRRLLAQRRHVSPPREEHVTSLQEEEDAPKARHNGVFRSVPAPRLRPDR